MVLDLEGRGHGGVKHLELAHQDLDAAGGQLLVVLALGTLAHGAGDLDGPLGADGLGGVEGGAAGVLGVKGDLRHAVAVAQVDEDQAAVVAAVPDPAGERDGLADVLGAQLATGVGVHGVSHSSSSRLFRPVSVRADSQQTATRRRLRSVARNSQLYHAPRPPTSGRAARKQTLT